MGKTFAEKILARKSGRSEVRPGEIVTVRPDHLLSHDNTAAIVEKISADLAEFGIASPDLQVIVLDHVVPAASKKTPRTIGPSANMSASTASSTSTTSARACATR